MPQASILELVCLFTWKIKVLKKKGEKSDDISDKLENSQIQASIHGEWDEEG